MCSNTATNILHDIDFAWHDTFRLSELNDTKNLISPCLLVKLAHIYTVQIVGDGRQPSDVLKQSPLYTQAAVV